MGKVVTVTLKADTKGVDKNLGKVDKSLKKTEKQAKETGDAMGNAIGNVSPRIGGLINQIKSIGTSFKALAVGAGVGAIAAVGALFASATAKGAEFAKQMSTLEAVSGATTEEMNALAESAKNLGSTTQFTAVEVGELQTEFAKMGFTTKQILASTEATLALAASMEVGLGQAAMLAGSTVNAFGLEAEDTQRVVDVLAESTSSSALSFGDLTQALKNAAPASKATGRTVEETAAMLGVLANNGLKGGRAGTGLSKAFIEMNKKGLDLFPTLERINNSSNSLGTAMAIAGDVGGKALLSLADKQDDIKRLTRTFENAEGAAQRMADIRLDNLAGDTTKLGSAWEGFLLSIEDGEGILMQIARAATQAATAFLNFITPVNRLSESMEEQRVALFDSEAQLDRLDEKMLDTTLTEEELKIAQDQRLVVIDKLKEAYPDYLADIDTETASTEDLKKAIDEVNKSLINRIIIQRKQEEIDDQAEDTADERIDLMDKEAKAQEYVNELKAKYSKLEIDFQETDPVKFLEELEQVRKSEVKLLNEGNGENKLKIGQLSKMSTEYNNLFFKVKSVNKADQDYQEELAKGNALLDEKESLMKELNITLDENKEKTDEETESNEELAEEQKSLIQIQQDLLAEAKKLPEFTEQQLIVKNKEIKIINEEIKRLKALGVEKLKINKINKTKVDNRAVEKALRDAERLRIAQEKAQQDELKREENQWNMLQKIRNTALDQELLELAQEYDKKQELAYGNTQLEEALHIEHLDRMEEIQDKYRDRARQAKKDDTQKSRDLRILQAQQALQIAAAGANAIQSIGDAVFAKKMQNLDLESKKGLEVAKKQFQFNKALQLGLAVIDGGKAVTASLAAAPLAIGVAPNPAGIASLAFAIATTGAQIAMIASKQFNPDGMGGGGGGGSDVGSAPIPSTSPEFNVVGQSGFNQVAGALGQQQPVQAYVVAQDVTTAQQLQNNTITQATF
tara:strand:+ start:1088 stop:3997 length:2910 start_codon:yes stop_codon:yes gene_type:complete